MDGQEVNTDGTKSSQAIKPLLFIRAFHADRLVERLGQDPYVLAIRLVDLQDRLWWRPVGLYREQGCDMCGFPRTSLRRFRAARKALIDDGWLRCEIPQNGERSQAVYELIEKLPLDNPEQFAPGATGTRCNSAPEPGADRLHTRSELTPHPEQIGTTSNPISLHTPTNPSNTPPTPSRGSLFGDEDGQVEEQTPKTRKQKQPRADPMLEIAIPAILDGPEFRIAWNEWQEHRKDIRKKLTPRSAKMQLDELAAMGPARAIAAINHSAANGYTGIFEPSRPQGSSSNRPNLSATPGQVHNATEKASNDVSRFL